MSPSAASDRSRRRLRSLSPAETIEIGRGLSISPRLKLMLTFFRSDLAVKPVDEWKLLVALLDFLRSSPGLSVSDDEDLRISRRPDLHKRKRDEPVASGTLYLRDLGFLKAKGRGEGEEDDDDKVLAKKFLDWRVSVIDRLDGISLNLEGVKFKMTVAMPPGDDFDRVKKDWEDFYASQYLNSRRGVATRPDTIIVRGVPSRWFAEPQVSSKASLLISHDIFLVFGKIRNIDVSDDNDLDNQGESKEPIISGLNCRVRVQYENYDDFCNAMRVLCGRSMQKEGSRLKVDYQVTWDKNGFFQHTQEKRASSYRQEKSRSAFDAIGSLRNGTSRYQQNAVNSDDAPRKRFRE